MSKDLFYELRSQEIAELVEKAENGEIYALKAYAELKHTSDLLSDAIKQNGSTRYSYKNIKSWNEKNKELKAIEEKSKMAYIAFSKGLLTADEFGEEIELPEISYTKDCLIVKK